MTTKKVSLIIGVLGMAGLFLWQLKPRTSYKMASIEVNDQVIRVETAASPSQRALGLGNRDSLAPDSGLLFLFPTLDYHSFWMMGMRFPIDIVWINGNKVVDMATGVPPPKEGELQLPTYAPDQKADRVLEINANKAKEWGIKIGSELTFRGIELSSQ